MVYNLKAKLRWRGSRLCSNDLSQHSPGDVFVLTLLLEGHVCLAELAGNLFECGRDRADDSNHIRFVGVSVDAHIANYRTALQYRLHFAQGNIPGG